MAKFLLFSVASVLVAYASGVLVNDDQVYLKCLPKRKFTYDHNHCECNDDGTEIFCQRKMYSTLTPILYQNQLQQVAQNCNPGETFMKICQKCICDKSGKYANCLRTGCSDKKSGTRHNCVAGTVFRDKCNACICGTDGKGVCTNLDCIALSSPNPNTTTCVPGANVFFYCNECTCTRPGEGMFCDRVGCISVDFDHNNLLNVTTSCTANSIFDYNCHQCQCDKTGSYGICHGTSCPRNYDLVKVVNTVDKCDPGMIFANGCNVCICNSDGKGTCTSLNCDLKYRFKYE